MIPEIPQSFFTEYCEENPIKGIIARKLVEEGKIRIIPDQNRAQERIKPLLHQARVQENTGGVAR